MDSIRANELLYKARYKNDEALFKFYKKNKKLLTEEVKELLIIIGKCKSSKDVNLIWEKLKKIKSEQEYKTLKKNVDFLSPGTYRAYLMKIKFLGEIKNNIEKQKQCNHIFDQDTRICSLCGYVNYIEKKEGKIK